MKNLNLVQIVALLFFPFTVILWYVTIDDIFSVAHLVLMPVIIWYLIPFVGTNIFKLWKFNTKYKFGNFSIFHGIILGSAINISGYLMYIISPDYVNIFNTIVFAGIGASFITFTNWLYDIYAMKNKYLVVNTNISKGKRAIEIAEDYVPPYFYSFGFIYCIFVKVFQFHIQNPMKNIYLIILLFYVLEFIVPNIVYMINSYVKYKNFGIKKYERK